ncbi:ArsR/SmtB family transcription factor [Zhihengliuella halotolerans]|uniref:DNA-binding transcriptional ArsR family regulator n=1 Tax=Zhihengliuella halotolerans TaxID=370736 RepID=A0A4Q8AGU9_9MICC|nr:helix-turn-helix domain-containing protein [Zhihengliuella halotolerans]RZU63524.1 DNA-binding transcriptional ArsR family regulator [Zhihengliuella halotolerans]
MHIRLTTEDLTRVRFESSPLWETAASIRALHRQPTIHRPWVDATRTALAGSPEPDKASYLDILSTVVRPRGYMADALTPTPVRHGTFADALADVAAVEPEIWRDNLEYVRRFDPVPRVVETVDLLLRDLPAGIANIVAALDWYWELAIEPWWPRLRSLQLADIDWRLSQLSRHGIHEVFKSLHPSVVPTTDGLEIMRDCDATGHPAPGSGLILVPNAFIWPETLVLNVAPFVPTLTYAPRGVGRLWETASPTPTAPLAKLLGRTRAQILAQLDVPMTTTQLACALDLAPATVNTHLKVMSAGGLTASLRTGREVFYRRADVGESLLIGA